jgi:hypothetical protein
MKFMSIANGNVPHVARPNTMRNHLMVLAMKTFTVRMFHLYPVQTRKPHGLSGNSTLRSIALEIPISPVKGSSSSRTRKIAQAKDSAHTNREAMTTRLVCANKVKLTKIALSQKTRMTRNGTGIEPPVCANNRWNAATMFLLFVPKMRQAQTFLATIENDDADMKTLAVISILALLTISGAAYTDQLLTGDQQTAQAAN